MGDCWDAKGFYTFKKDVIETNKEIGKTFRRAYRYFAAAKAVHDDWSNFNNEALNLSKLNKTKEDLNSTLLPNPIGSMGSDRHLFATAFTPNGIVTFINTLYTNYEKIYTLNGGPGTGKTEVFKYLSDNALMKGYNIEIYHDPLIPERIEHLLIPELKIAILSANEINSKRFNGVQIYMDNLLNGHIISKNRSEMQIDIDNFNNLLNKGLQTIATAKKLHDQLETYYVPNMDFDKVNEKVKYVIDKFESYE